MNSMKRQNDRTLKDELPDRKVPNILLEKSGEITSERRKRWSQSKCPVVDVTGDGSKI